MRVVKFGGTSLSTGEQFERVSQIMQANPERQVVVTSAPGKRFKQDIKVTDLLIQAAKLRRVTRHCGSLSGHRELF